MQRLPLYQIDAFAAGPFQGNPAAVCPLEAWLPEATLQAIAEENNLSETAFYVESSSGVELRWFTPLREVDLCGHATLAAAHVYFQRSAKSADRVTFESKSGPLHVYRDKNWLTLDFPAQPGLPCAAPDALVEALGIEPQACLRAMDYLVICDSEATVRQIQPDFQTLRNLDLRGVIVSAAGESVDFVSRFFAPKYGIDEDPVTGSAHCTLTPYWAPLLGKPNLTAQQISKRGGTLRCRSVGDRVLISGQTVAYLEGTIRIH